MAREKSALVFLEYPDEADVYLRQQASRRILPSPAKLIALNPVTLAYLKRRGYEAEDTQPYLTSASRGRALQRSAELTRWMRDHFDFVDNWGVRAGYVENLVWYTRWLANYLLWSLEILDNAVTRHDASALRVCMPEPLDVSGPMAGNKERYFGTMAGRFAETRGLELHPIPVRIHTSLRERNNNAVRRLVTALAPNPLVARLHRQQLRRLASRGPVLFTSQYYRMNVLARRIVQEQGASPVLLSDWGSQRFLGWPVMMRVIPPFAAEARLSLLEPLAREDKSSRRHLEVVINTFAGEVSQATDRFSHLGVSFADIVARKVRHGIGPAILGLHRRAAALHFLLQTLHPSLVLANGSRVDDMITGELCRAAHIPAMVITHGSHTPPSNDAECYEWGEHGRRLINAPYEFTALQSPVAEEFRKVFPGDSKGMRTGPLIWAKSEDRSRSAALRERMLGDGRKDRVIVHAGTPKGKIGVRFHVFETPDEYIQGIRDLGNAVDQVSGARLIVMFRPSPEIGLDDLKTLVAFSDKAMVSVDAPLVDVLGFADLLVSFSSTVIEEALQNRVPVLLYGGDGRYQHVKAISIAKGDTPGYSAVYHVKNRADLPYAIQYILSSCNRDKVRDDIFTKYIYQPDQVTPISHLIKCLRKTAGG
jgi:hypothetical protein